MAQEFDYKGFSAEKLEELCHDSYGEQSIARDKYWTVSAYSMGQFIREYADIPATVPLPCYSAHGMDYDSITAPHEINNDAAFFLCYNSNKDKSYRKLSSKPCYIVPMPMPWLRRKYKMEQSPAAKGTIAYFQHSTPEINFLDDLRTVVNNYIDELLLLPKILHPICVCLHMHDVRKGVHRLFLERDIPVYTSGNVFNIKFYKEFYDMLLNFAYSTSAAIGSYTFYSIEAGIPFFLHGEEKLYYNVGDSGIKKGVYGDRVSLIKKNLHSTFGTFSSEITTQQRKTVDFFLGEGCDVISPEKLKNKIFTALQG